MAGMPPFHVLIRARSRHAATGRTIAVAGVDCETLAIPSEDATLFEVSFETACEGLGELPRLFIEPDGSFVWTGDSPQGAWQLDGNLFDRAERLCHVECKGWAPAERLDAFLKCLGWPETAVVFEHVAAGVLLSEDTFRGLCGGHSPA